MKAYIAGGCYEHGRNSFLFKSNSGLQLAGTHQTAAAVQSRLEQAILLKK